MGQLPERDTTAGCRQSARPQQTFAGFVLQRVFYLHCIDSTDRCSAGTTLRGVTSEQPRSLCSATTCRLPGGRVPAAQGRPVHPPARLVSSGAWNNCLAQGNRRLQCRLTFHCRCSHRAHLFPAGTRRIAATSTTMTAPCARCTLCSRVTLSPPLPSATRLVRLMGKQPAARGGAERHAGRASLGQGQLVVSMGSLS